MLPTCFELNKFSFDIRFKDACTGIVALAIPPMNSQLITLDHLLFWITYPYKALCMGVCGAKCS